MTETSSRNSATQKQAKTWLTPEQIERIRDSCLSETFATYLQDRNETLIVLLADTGLRVSELVALNWEYLDLDAEPGELYLPSEIQKGKLLNGLRLFLQTCPTSGGNIALTEETVESCCQSHEVIAAICTDTGERLFEHPVPMENN